ncbi:MAG: hypothetical protein Q8O55_05085 [Dehalococcoidales bacterium]|nr:hypothetical protein [Dehalococcoidales bacterium]
MKSEALRKIKTMRQVKISLDVARGQRFRTTNSLSKTKEETGHMESLTDRRLEQTLEKERRRFAAYEMAVNKSRQRVLMSREKLAMTLNRNRALTELRHQLQQSRWEGNDPVLPKVQARNQPNRQIELRY